MSFICPYVECRKQFSRKAILEDHILTHSDLKPHRCTSCNKAFTRSSDCKRHRREKHGGLKFKCGSQHAGESSGCGKSFSRALTLKRHLKDCPSTTRSASSSSNIFDASEVAPAIPPTTTDCSEEQHEASNTLNLRVTDVLPSAEAMAYKHKLLSNSKLSCPYCGGCRWLPLLFHIFHELEHLREVRKGIYICDSCKMLLPTSLHYAVHTESCANGSNEDWTCFRIMSPSKLRMYGRWGCDEKFDCHFDLLHHLNGVDGNSCYRTRMLIIQELEYEILKYLRQNLPQSIYERISEPDADIDLFELEIMELVYV